jgi:short-subunit dehydrogenase
MNAHATKAKLGVVTGAGSGIGRAIAEQLAGRGVDLWLVGRRQQTLEDVAAAVRRHGVQAWPFPCDLANDADLERLRTTVTQAGRGLDVLVHSAGSHLLGAVADAPVAELDEQYRLNLRAPYLLTQQLLPSLRARRGDIVFVNSSVVGLEARIQTGAYAATKHGLKALADVLRQEVNADGIRVLSVFPGQTATPLQEARYAREGKAYNADQLLQPADVAAAVVQALDLPRTAEITDLRVRPSRPPGTAG